MPSAPTFTVIIVNYNGGEFVQGALSSLAQQTFRDFEILLIDNNSTDGSADTLDASGLPSFKLLKEKENHGFASANNMGAKLARGKWLALLNPDAVAEPDWLEKTFAATERHPDCNVFACGQRSLDDPSKLDGTGDAYLVFGIPWRGGFEYPISALPKEDGNCFSPCGASAVYLRETFLRHGGFDERFFCYCEDVDLGLRMQLSGEKCIFVPSALIWHKGGGTSGRNSYFTTFHGNRNRTWTYLKNMPLLLLILTLPGHIALLSYIYLRNRNKLSNSAMADGIKAGFKEGWKLRRQSEFKAPKRKISLLQLTRTMAWNPWLMARRGVHIRPL
ncbi:MAG: glycosyltransferase family 2 protein [Henriciella sp.]